MRKIDRRILVITSLIFILGMAYGLMRYLILIKEEPKSRPQKESQRFVKAQPVKYTTVLSPTTAPGRLYPLAEFDLVAEASGKILQGNVSLKKGATFLKGQVLFTVYPDELALAIKASKSQYLNTLVNAMPDIKIDYPDYEESFDTFFASIKLYKRLPAMPEVKDEQFKIFLSSRNLISEYYKIKKDELQLSRHSVYAPFSGTFKEVYTETGAYINMGGKVARMIQTNMLEMEVPLERFDADWVKVGDKVKVYSEKSGQEKMGVVVRKNLFIDENTQSQGVFIRINNTQEPVFLTGEYLKAYFPGHPVKNSMEIPRNIVFNSNEVFVVKNKRLQKRKINIIKINNENTLVFNGLPEGDTLVMQPLINVQEGSLVEIHGMGEKR
jgi:membrane fusion protein (multidrug efflux system)